MAVPANPTNSVCVKSYSCVDGLALVGVLPTTIDLPVFVSTESSNTLYVRYFAVIFVIRSSAALLTSKEKQSLLPPTAVRASEPVSCFEDGSLIATVVFRPLRKPCPSLQSSTLCTVTKLSSMMLYSCCSSENYVPIPELPAMLGAS